MSDRYDSIRQQLMRHPQKWLITGVAGFIGSNLLEALLKLDQDVTGLDNFATGHQCNLDEVRSLVTPEQWSRFRFIEGDIRHIEDCRAAVRDIDHVLHEAALGSVPRSVNDPIATHEVNISGFLNMLIAARDAEVESFTYAASSSTYGDHPGLPKVEDRIGQPLSPYAVTKYANELYATVFGAPTALTPWDCGTSTCSESVRIPTVHMPRSFRNGRPRSLTTRTSSSMATAKRAAISVSSTTWCR